MKIGLIATGAGGALDAALSLTRLIHPSACFIGFSDRYCGALEVLQKHCAITSLHESTCKEEISDHAYKLFRSNSCEIIVLLYSRLIASRLYDNFSCYNVHPSLLPNYKGFGAVEAAFCDSAKVLGVTIHEVDSSVDAGPINCQVKTIPTVKNIKYWQSLSFLMKVLLLVSFLDKKLGANTESVLHTICCTPNLPEVMQLLGISTSTKIQKGFRDVVRKSEAFSIYSSL